MRSRTKPPSPLSVAAAGVIHERTATARPVRDAVYDLTIASQEGRLPRCMQPWQSLMIDVTGAVQPCAYRGNYTNLENAEPLGNVNHQTLEEIWNGPMARKVRRTMAAGDLKSAGCGRCLAVAQNQALGLEWDQRCLDDERAPEYRRNIARKIEEIVSGSETCRSRPTVLYYTPDHRCNLHCIHCYQNASRTDSIGRRAVADELLALGPYLSDVVAGGGEPLILPFWRRFLASNSRQSNPFLRFVTTTNATIIRDEVWRQLDLFERIAIIVSLDGPTKETFELVREPANWEKFLANAQRLRELCSRKGAFFSFNIAVMKANILELPAFVSFCARYAAPYNYQPVVSYPAKQSLRCFNDLGRETNGWRDAIERARQVLRDEFLPAMRGAAASGEAAWDENYVVTYEGQLAALEDLVPWEVLALRHHRVSGCLPWVFGRWFLEAVSSMARTHRPKGRGFIILFYQLAADGPREPRYYAPLDADMRFEVSLPDGAYGCFVIGEDIAAPRSQGWDVRVKVADGVPTVGVGWVGLTRRAKLWLWLKGTALLSVVSARQGPHRRRSGETHSR